MTEDAAREVIRWTARTSLVLFCAAFAGAGLRLASATRARLLRGLAASHLVHGVAILALAHLTAGRNLMERASPLLVIGGGVGYALILHAGWKPLARLTSLGLFWIWAVFLVSYSGRALAAPMPFAIPVALLAIALLLRLKDGVGDIVRAVPRHPVLGVRQHDEA